MVTKFLTIPTFWKYWLIYMFMLGIFYIIGLISEYNNGPSPFRKLKNYTLHVPKAKFINRVIEWCKQNMEHPKYHKYYPIVEVKYYKTKKVSGDYCSSNQIIRIFVNNHQTIDELIDTCIHEYVHYLQMPFQTNQVEYNKFNKTRGYHKNPYEIEARERAAFTTPKCIKDLKRLGYIS